MKKKIYLIGIGGIGVSALARLYIEKGYEVFGSDKTNSEIIQKLIQEGANIIIGENEERINNTFESIIYTEAIPKNQKELQKAQSLGIEVLTYPKALAKLANKEKLITIAGTHGKSTTTSLISLILLNTQKNFTSIVGSLLKEFGGKNFYHRNKNKSLEEKPYFVIEACEYKRSFLAYKPSIGIITNIEIDHLDYYKDLNDYLKAYESYLDNIIPGGIAILNGQDINCQKLSHKRQDINYIEVFNEYFLFRGEKIFFPEIKLKIPGDHILYDAKIAFCLGIITGVKSEEIQQTLSVYNGIWRRSEQVGQTLNNNLVMSDYGHHPTEIKLTLKGIKTNNLDKKILTIFQPHQYNRTLELLEDFKNSFNDTDILIIPNIYESRDSEEDKKKINSKKLVSLINHKHKYDGNGFENTISLIEKFDNENKNNLIIILLGAGNVDDLRYKIKMK